MEHGEAKIFTKRKVFRDPKVGRAEISNTLGTVLGIDTCEG